MTKNSEKMSKFEFASATVTPSGIVVPDIMDKKTSQPWVSWGQDNKLPLVLWDNYLKCSNLQAIVNTMRDYILGEGVISNWVLPSSSGETIDDIISRCIFDYILFGGFALEGIRNYKGDVCVYNYVNVMDVRVNEQLTLAYLSSAWKSYSGKDVRILPLYNPKEHQNHFIFYFRGEITRNINPIPLYVSALKSIEILNNTRNFHLRNLEHDFSASAIISLNNGNIKKKELDEIKDKLEKQFCGTENAGKFILINNPDKEHDVTIQRLNASNFSDLYQALSESSVDDLYVAFRINKMLVGVNVQTGFSQEEFENCYKLYDRTVITPLKNVLIKAFRSIDIEIEFKPFKINWAD